MIRRIAMVSSMLCLRSFRAGLRSNARAIALPHSSTVVATVLALMLAHTPVAAQSGPSSPAPSRVQRAGLFLGGAAVAFGAHESGHLVFNLLFDADPGIGKVDFHGFPFFAITHRSGLSPKREFTISSAGFWVQHGGSEWLLTRRPNLRREHAPFAKGIL